MFHYTTQNLQDQDRFFWSQTGLVLRPTVSDHITVYAGKSCKPGSGVGVRLKELVGVNIEKIEGVGSGEGLCPPALLKMFYRMPIEVYRTL